MASTIEALALARESAALVTPSPDALTRAARDGAASDANIAAAVTVALARAPAIPAVGVDVNARVVTLSGQVIDEAQRERAARLAKGVHGVVDVDNQLQLSTDLGARMQATLRDLRGKLNRAIAALPLLAIALMLVLAGAWTGRLVSRYVGKLRLSASNPYLDALVRRGTQLACLGVGIVLALDLLGATKLVGALLGSAGILGLAIGFAFRDIAENHIAGIMLSLRRPFAPGDHIVVDGHEGRVVSLSSRVTLLMTLDGNHLRLPNAAVFKAPILNYTQNPHRRMSVRTEIDAGASITEASEAGLAALGAIEGILPEPPPRMLVLGYGASGTSLEFQAWADQNHHDFALLSSAAHHAIKKALVGRGIETPRNVQYLVQAETPPHARASAAQAPEVVSQKTGVDRHLAAQVARAQEEQADNNLIASDQCRSE